MIVKILYHDKTISANVIKDFKVNISQEDAGCKGQLEDEYCQIELDQCQKCGVWLSEDEEMYEAKDSGIMYCSPCTQMCNGCEYNFCIDDVTAIPDEKIRHIPDYFCPDCHKKQLPNNYKYKKALDDLDDIEAIKGDVKVTLQYIGEGKSGDYTGEEDDIPLIRFSVNKKEPANYSYPGAEHPDWDWCEVENSSYCTQIPVDTSKEELEKIASFILDKVEESVTIGDGIKRLCEELSYYVMR